MRATVKRLFLLAGSAACFSTALADIPAALDRVPANAPVAMAVQNIEKFDAKFKKLTAVFGPAAEANPDMAAVASLLNTPGLNRSGSLAVAVMEDPGKPEGAAAPDPMNGDDMLQNGPVVVIVPVTDAAKFIEAFGGDPKAFTKDAVLELDGPADAPEFPGPMFAKDLGGGYIAMGPMKDVVTKFDGAAGRLAAHTTALGATGKRIADSADWLIVSNIAAIAPAVRQNMQDMKQQAAAAMQMAGGGNEQMLDLADSAANAFLRDAQVGVVGFGIDDGGVWVDLGAQFKEGSEASKLMQGKSGADKLTGRLPNQAFIFAGSIDSSQPGVRSMLGDALKAAAAGTAENKGPAGPGIWADLGKMVEKLDGSSFLVGTSPGGIMGGLLANSVAFVATKDPATYTGVLKQAAKDFNGKTIDGITYTTTYEEGAAEAGGAKIDKYSMLGQVDPNSPMAMQMQQAMMMMYGAAGGPSGFVAPVEGGVIQTMTPNTPLVTAAMESAKTGKGLSEHAELKAVADKLPANRAMEMFIGVRSILDMIGPFLPIAADAPAVIPPIGMGLAATEGGGQFRVYVPNAVLETIAGFAEEAAGEEMDAPADDAGKPPRF